MAEGDKPMDVASSNDSNGNSQLSKVLVARPVAAGSSGNGSPYAPEDWPAPGDVWRWRVGRRKCVSGHWLDRSVHPPRHLPSTPGGRGFHSKLSLEHYIRTEFPDADVDAFLASFLWKVPVSDHDKKEEVDKSTYRSCKKLEANGSYNSEPASKPSVCKAGNKMCSLRSKAKSCSLVAKSCNICCTEAGFCRDCCCILCSETVDWTYNGYSFIRCEANVDENFVCGHVAHLDCALRAYLAGKVGGCIVLDAQYYCRRCDNKTDLTSHVTKLIKTCESLDSRDDIEKILSLGFRILHSSVQERAKHLQEHISLVMAKLNNGVPFGDTWREDKDISATTAENRITILGATENSIDSISTIDSMNWIEQFHEIDEEPEGSVFITSDHINVSTKLEDELEEVLRQLKKSQELEYRLAKQKLYAQKDLLLSLYKQLEAARSELASPMNLPHCNVNDKLLTHVLNRVDEIKNEAAKLQQMVKVANGFGQTPASILSDCFGLPAND